jgi:cation diffusion facilitator CzcD-associated flavoprotein CzcO
MNPLGPLPGTVPSRSAAPRGAETDSVDAVVVGAGFAGIYTLYRLRSLGLSVRVLEAGSDIGGTWFWNRYPGARCDVESMDYSYSFSEELQQEWSWTERYASQPEILNYINHVADRFDLRRDITVSTRVVAATFDEERCRWTVETDDGHRLSATYCVMATGSLSAARVPDIPGLETFTGSWYHTGNWPHRAVDFTGQQVGVIGTGSSGVQSIPLIAEQADRLFVFQRTPNFSIPAQNGPMDPEQERQWKAGYTEHRRMARETPSGMLREINDQSALSVTADERQHQYETRWKHGGPGFTVAFTDLLTNQDANHTAAEFVRQQIADTVHDPEVAERLMPRNHPLGAKRICVDTDYYGTFNRSNVTLVDLAATPIDSIVPGGIRTTDAEYRLDSLVFATGFDAMTGALFNIGIAGRGGLPLREKWAAGPRTYLGLATAGFPNLFLVAGAGSPSVLSNMVLAIEQHVDWIADCIASLRANHLHCIEASIDAEDKWVDHVNESADRTLYPSANSWYVGANIPGKARVFMPYVGGAGTYRKICDWIAATGYEGFILS